MTPETYIHRCATRSSDHGTDGRITDCVQLAYAREAMFAVLCPAERATTLFPHGLIVLRHEINYHTSMHHRSTPIPLETWVVRIGQRAFTVQITARVQGRPLFSARTTVAPSDEHKRPRDLTREEDAHLKTFTVPRLRRSPRTTTSAAIPTFED
ncbi:hypothetical protein H9Y04_43710 [Streptomyces sp. TRM66268-LWL]|uniref:Thioesterase n=1 Tax=Streptomyces polyasparticus TaxID=2767826 RepID=A0ABR7SVB3_9ACTN|nr:hypothetical protein [Streptomyces polyasparticus]MBC9719435.1 hypothetical protein [Streptomyces polyasparticus]